MIVSTFAVSATPSAAVGSSISTSFAAQWVARAIATPWRWPPERSRIVDVADGMRTSSAAHQLLASRGSCAGGRGAGTDRSPARGRGRGSCRPAGCSASARSWKTTWMPRACDVARIGEAGFLAVDQNAPVGRRIDAADDLHQRRLAGAVVADQRDHLAGVRRRARNSRSRRRRRTPCGCSRRPRTGARHRVRSAAAAAGIARLLDRPVGRTAERVVDRADRRRARRRCRRRRRYRRGSRRPAGGSRRRRCRRRGRRRAGPVVDHAVIVDRRRRRNLDAAERRAEPSSARARRSP